MLVKVINCLRLSAVVIYCCHGDGSGGRHVNHSHTHYYQATMLVIAINCLRLIFTMVMVVMGGMSVQSITAICTTISNL